jgi:hypothetical protein
MEDLFLQIQKQKQLLTKLQASMKRIAVPQSDNGKRITVLKKELGGIEKYRPDLRLDTGIAQELALLLDRSREELKQKEEEQKTKFGLELERLLQAHQFRLEGNYPKLRAAFYSFTVDISANKVTIFFGPDMEKLAMTKAIPEEVVATVLKNHEMITQRPLDEPVFLLTLRRAYQMYIAQSRNQKRIGDDAPLPEIHTLYSVLIQNEKFRKNPVKRNFSEYSRPMFSYDLSRLKNRKIDQSELRLITATRSDTRTSMDFLWVPHSDLSLKGETISRLKFVG